MTPKTKKPLDPNLAAELRREKRLTLLFSLTSADYEIILSFQKGVCAICKKPPKVGGKRLAVDHDHKTGQVRGLLCWNCNRALGRLKDDLGRILAMAEFLQYPPAVLALGRPVYGQKGRVTKKRPRRTTKRKSR